jgi:hypothetical protein
MRRRVVEPGCLPLSTKAVASDVSFTSMTPEIPSE